MIDKIIDKVQKIIVKRQSFQKYIVAFSSIGMIYLFLFGLRISFYCSLVEILPEDIWLFTKTLCKEPYLSPDYLWQALFGFLLTLGAVYGFVYYKSEDKKKKMNELAYHIVLLCVAYVFFIITSVMFKVIADNPNIHFILKYGLIILSIYLMFIHCISILWTIGHGLASGVTQIWKNIDKE